MLTCLKHFYLPCLQYRIYYYSTRKMKKIQTNLAIQCSGMNVFENSNRSLIQSALNYYINYCLVSIKEFKNFYKYVYEVN